MKSVFQTCVSFQVKRLLERINPESCRQRTPISNSALHDKKNWEGLNLDLAVKQKNTQPQQKGRRKDCTFL